MVATAKGLRKRGHSLRAIAVELTAQGYRNERGGQFSHSAVRAMVKANPRPQRARTRPIPGASQRKASTHPVQVR